MKRRFLYVGGFRLPDKNAAAHRVLAVGKLLRLMGCEVVFLDIDPERSTDELSAMKLVEGFEAYSQRYPAATKEWARYITTPLHVKEILDRYDDWAGVIAYNYPAVALYRLIRLCRARGICAIADATEWYQVSGPLTLRNAAVTLDTFLRMRFVHKRVDGLIAISSYLYRYYQAAVPVVHLPAMVDRSMEKWHVIPQKLPRETCNLVYAGSPGVLKDDLAGIYRLIRQNRHVRVFVLGMEKPEELEAELAAGITFLGRREHEECIRYIRGADYFLLLRKENRVTLAGFPTKFAEGVSCGTPVICSDVGEPYEFVCVHQNGIVIGNGSEDACVIPERGSEAYRRMKANAERLCMQYDYSNYAAALGLWREQGRQK